ncbi:MAG: hypothetical protein KatS3mg033_2351 [Thermonema sp.]|uniref:serine hydrolase domain-containing protein n=1 Tax=Thermonema sp. TaxID=2231181 RepID=UPI0021DC887E|nr:serine hydrolase domain-containing protein [Thermonema sp.]GIV40551.1 MAG: hypothetical protein KatS3mg033_2351 [Thermonema sp.]
MHRILRLCCLLTVHLLAAQPDTTYLTMRVQQLMQEAQVEGVSLALLIDGKTYWVKSFGWANARTKQPLTDTTVMEAASLSKPVAGYIALRLAQEGILDLDKPLADYLSPAELQAFAGGTVTDRRWYLITAKHVLSHSSGLPNGRYGKLTIAFSPGSDLSYSGQGFAFLQKVCEKLTGDDFETLAGRYVFEPLQMSRSSFVFRSRFLGNAAYGHWKNGYPSHMRRHAEAGAHHSLLTTAAEYARFLEEMLKPRYLKPEWHALMLRPHSSARTGALKSLEWGLGVGVYDWQGMPVFWHWGDYGNYKNYMMGVPAKGWGMVVLVNSEKGFRIIESILRASFPVEPLPLHVLGYESYDSPYKTLLAAWKQGQLNFVMEQLNRLKTMRKAELLPSDFTRLALFCWKNGRHDMVEVILKLALLFYEQQPAALELIGDVYMQINQKERALACYKAAFRILPYHPALKAKIEAAATP